MSIAFNMHAQSKIGGNPVSINANAYLEIGDSTGSTKGLLFPRVALTATNIAAPLTAHVAGMTVYNTAISGSMPFNVSPGLYYNDGAQWQKLESAAGGVFLRVSDSISVYVTPTQMNAALAGKLNVADTAAMLLNYINTVTNGLSRNGQAAELGGTLTHPTIINASGINTLALTGLQAGTAADSIVVSENGTGVLKKVPPGAFASNIAKASYSATAGQTVFTVPHTISDINKVSLYRNGVRLDVILVNSTTVQLEPGISCDVNDEIRIIQYY